jgi:co-chaperonin GroES (HSP10)
LQALTKFVVIKPIETKGMALGGEALLEGEVLSIGSKVEDLKIGDKVVFNKGHAMEYTIDGVNCYFINYETIFIKK